MIYINTILKTEVKFYFSFEEYWNSSKTVYAGNEVLTRKTNNFIISKLKLFFSLKLK